MPMDSNDKNKISWRIFRRFKYAIDGIWYAIKHERNLQIHLIITVFVLTLSFVYKVPVNDFLILLLMIGIVISFELVNTAIERAVDLATQEYHPLAKIAKDVAAGAVLVVSIIAVIIGLIIFLPLL